MGYMDMSDEREMYRTYTKKDILAELDAFPAINAKRVEQQINDLFRAYLFFRDEKGTRHIQASCCGKSFDMPFRTMRSQDFDAFYGKHNDEAVCPKCGRAVRLKQIARLGKKQKLEEYQPVAILSRRRGEIYVRAYWARKDYAELMAPPKVMLVEAYHFKPGQATMYFPSSWDGKWTKNVCEGRYNPNQRIIHEPFTESCMLGYRYISYHVIGLDAIEKSAFRYCLYGVHIDTGPMKWDLMKYLAACCIWPRDIEMLQKMGVNELVNDLICGRKINKACYTWGESDPKTAFDLDGQELREWLQDKNLKHLELYKRLRKKKLNTGFEMIQHIEDAVGPYHLEKLVKLCIDMKIKPERLMRYLVQFTGEGVNPLHHTWQLYSDYIMMLHDLGRDDSPHNVRFPHNLTLAHDEACKELAALNMMRAREAKEEERRKAEELLKTRTKRFNFEHGDYFVRVAETDEEIRAEGEALKHCVGGYAQRHMAGKTTILFLRRKDDPDKPLYTIEIMAGQLKQIHGYRNDVGKRPVTQTMAWFLDPWCDWWQHGSRRDKAGNPILRNRKEKKTA